MDTRKAHAGWIGVVICLGALGCATTHVRTDHDQSANFTPYHTFALKTGQVLNEGLVDTRDTLTRGRIDNALNENLIEKGLRPVEQNQNPDVIVTYTARTVVVQDITPYWDWYANPWWNYQYRHGTLIIDVIDANTKKLVWRSVVQANDKDFRSASYIDKAVDKALKKYPAAGPVAAAEQPS